MEATQIRSFRNVIQNSYSLGQVVDWQQKDRNTYSFYEYGNRIINCSPRWDRWHGVEAPIQYTLNPGSQVPRANKFYLIFSGLPLQNLLLFILPAPKILRLFLDYLQNFCNFAAFHMVYHHYIKISGCAFCQQQKSRISCKELKHCYMNFAYFFPLFLHCFRADILKTNTAWKEVFPQVLHNRMTR